MQVGLGEVSESLEKQRIFVSPNTFMHPHLKLLSAFPKLLMSVSNPCPLWYGYLVPDILVLNCEFLESLSYILSHLLFPAPTAKQSLKNTC